MLFVNNNYFVYVFVVSIEYRFNAYNNKWNNKINKNTFTNFNFDSSSKTV